jgi:PilZ domain
MEHRWGDRRSVALRVRIRRRGQNPAIGWLTDISISGAYVHTSAALPLVSRIQVAVDECGAGNLALRPLRLLGRIVRHGPVGVGVEWEEFASETLDPILRIAMSIHRYRAAVRAETAQDQGSWTRPTHRMACRKMLCIAP